MEIASVAAVSVISYLLGMILKAWDAFDDRKIPVIMGAVGAALGLIGYFTVPEVIPAHDPFTAVAVGIVSGFSATGINQLVKQARKEADNGTESD